MILDQLVLASRYVSLHPGLAAGFDFLRRPESAQLADGKHTIDGDRLFALVAHDPGRGKEQSPLEAHRRYIDIQYVVAGEDLIGWKALADCTRISSPYSGEKDIGFFFDRPDTWLAVPAGSFTLFWPDDAHAPLATEGPTHKIVVKVAMAWR